MQKPTSQNRIATLMSEHPASVGETYFQHMQVSFTFSIQLITAGLAAFIHALIPVCFERTASETIKKLHTNMIDQRDQSKRH